MQEKGAMYWIGLFGFIFLFHLGVVGGFIWGIAWYFIYQKGRDVLDTLEKATNQNEQQSQQQEHKDITENEETK